MKTIASEHGNSGDFMDAKDKVWKEKPFRYITFATSGGSGAIGGGFHYEIRGTNNMRELLKPATIKNVDEIFDTKTGKEIPKNKLARELINSLGQGERQDLIDEMLEKYLTA